MSSLIHTIGGIFQPLLKGVADVLAFFYSLIPNYPIDVAMLTIVIMALLTPLTIKSTKSMAAMQRLGPEMKKLQQKYKGAENRVQLNEEMMRLYKEHNVNPASGCLPMLLQMPAFLVLYDVIRGITNVTAAYTTKVNGKTVYHAAVSNPRYINHDSKMYHAITSAKPPGALNAFGMNFSNKLLSHHSSYWAAIPFLLLVLASVGLQYLQMSRLNARNPQAAQANPQAAMMQKYMPLIFGVIYLNVAAILNVYFIVSSSIRIATQEILFRKGIVAGPPATATGSKSSASNGKSNGKAKGATSTERALPKPRTNGAIAAAKNGAAKGKATSSPKAATGKSSSTSNGDSPNGAKSTSGSNGSRSKAVSSKTSSNGNSNDNGSSSEEAAEVKAHPRSKSKRERKDW